MEGASLDVAGILFLSSKDFGIGFYIRNSKGKEQSKVVFVTSRPHSGGESVWNVFR